MRRAVLFLAAAAAFGLGPVTFHLGPVVGSVVFVAMGVMLALAASGSVTAMAVAAGAAGAFTAGVLAHASIAAAGAVLLGLAYAERTVRVRGAAPRAAHLGLALTAGAVAGALATSYRASDLLVRAVVVLVSAVLCSLPSLVEADDPVAHALDELSGDVDEPSRCSLREGAELRRTVDESMLDRASRRVVRRTWQSLLELAVARARLEGAAGKVAAIADSASKGARKSHRDAVKRRLDERIADHVAALARAYTAAGEAHAAEIGCDDDALRSVETAGESLEQVSKVLVEEL